MASKFGLIIPSFHDLLNKVRPIAQLIPHITGVIAFFISIYSVYLSLKTTHDVALNEDTRTEYTLMHDLDRLRIEHPRMSHLLAFPGEQYAQASELVKGATPTVDQTALSQFKLEEMATASFVFETYEETYFHWSHAVESGDSERSLTLGRDLSYFKDLLCNERLQWLWNGKSGVGLEVQYADDVKDYYEKTILPCAQPPDPNGPLK